MSGVGVRAAPDRTAQPLGRDTTGTPIAAVLPEVVGKIGVTYRIRAGVAALRGRFPTFGNNNGCLAAGDVH